MADHRTKREKLEAMASQTISPTEAEVARQKLEKMGPENGGPYTAKRRGKKTSYAYEFEPDISKYEKLYREFAAAWEEELKK